MQFRRCGNVGLRGPTPLAGARGLARGGPQVPLALLSVKKDVKKEKDLTQRTLRSEHGGTEQRSSGDGEVNLPLLAGGVRMAR